VGGIIKSGRVVTIWTSGMRNRIFKEIALKYRIENDKNVT